MRSQASDNGEKIEPNSSALPYRNDPLTLALTRTMSFNPHQEADVELQTPSVETQHHYYIPPADRVQFSPFAKGRVIPQ